MTYINPRFESTCPRCGCHLCIDRDERTVVNPTAATATATYLDSERVPVVIDIYDHQHIYPCHPRRAKA